MLRSLLSKDSRVDEAIIGAHMLLLIAGVYAYGVSFDLFGCVAMSYLTVSSFWAVRSSTVSAESDGAEVATRTPAKGQPRSLELWFRCADCPPE